LLVFVGGVEVRSGGERGGGLVGGFGLVLGEGCWWGWDGVTYGYGLAWGGGHAWFGRGMGCWCWERMSVVVV
jgi:hypothetical protein